MPFSIHYALCIDLVGTSGLEPPTSRLSGVRSNHLSYAPIRSYYGRSFPLIPLGGDEEDRTPDPLRARQVLSQLSYTPRFFKGLGSVLYLFCCEDTKAIPSERLYFGILKIE